MTTRRRRAPAMLTQTNGTPPMWTGDQAADALLARCGFSDHLIRRAIETMGAELDATTLDGEPEWAARGRGVDHVLTVAGLKRVERQQVDVEGGGLTVVMKQYVVSTVAPAAAAASTGAGAPDPAIRSLPVRSDRPREDQALAVSPATTELEDEPTPATDTVRITVKHFGDPEPR
jgi:hypothetical protein